MSLTCKECGAKCCKYFCFEIDEPDCFEEFDDIRWYLCHKGVSVHIDEGDWFISIANRCNMLETDNGCRMYEDRPIICRKYDPDNCDHTGGDYGYDEEFTRPEQIDAYARKTLGEAKYERDRARMRAKLEIKPKTKPKTIAKRKTSGKKGTGKRSAKKA